MDDEVKTMLNKLYSLRMGLLVFALAQNALNATRKKISLIDEENLSYAKEKYEKEKNKKHHHVYADCDTYGEGVAMSAKFFLCAFLFSYLMDAFLGIFILLFDPWGFHTWLQKVFHYEGILGYFYRTSLIVSFFFGLLVFIFILLYTSITLFIEKSYEKQSEYASKACAKVEDMNAPVKLSKKAAYYVYENYVREEMSWSHMTQTTYQYLTNNFSSLLSVDHWQYLDLIIDYFEEQKCINMMEALGLLANDIDSGQIESLEKNIGEKVGKKQKENYNSDQYAKLVELLSDEGKAEIFYTTFINQAMKNHATVPTTYNVSFLKYIRKERPKEVTEL